MSTKQNIIYRIIKIVNINDPDSEVYLYGSRARGDAKLLSDWKTNHPITPLFQNIQKEGVRLK
jgi:hypothetical protein